MRLTADQELRREFLLFALSKQPDVEAAIEMAAQMERFVLSGQPERKDRNPEMLQSVARAGQSGASNATNSSLPGACNAAAAAAAAGMSDQSDSVLRKRRWSEVDDREFKRLWQSALSLEEIAEELDRTVPSLYSRARAMGLARRNPKSSVAAGKSVPDLAKYGEQGSAESTVDSRGKGGKLAKASAAQGSGSLAAAQRTLGCDRYQAATTSESKRSNGSRKTAGSKAETSSVGSPSAETPQSVQVDYFIEPVIQFLRSRDYSVIRIGDGQFQLDGRTVLNAEELRKKANQLRKSLGQPLFTSHFEEAAS